MMNKIKDETIFELRKGMEKRIFKCAKGYEGFTVF